MATIRAMTEKDVDAVEEASEAAFAALRQQEHLAPEERTEESVRRGRHKIGHLLSTDPGGSWVAADGERVVGVAQALVQGDVWVLSLLAVLPSHQDRGAGRALLDAALGYGDPTGPGIILASPDPRALHRYCTAGFDLHPCLVARGPLRTRPPAAPGVVTVPGAAEGTTELSSALDEVDQIDAKVRGASRRDGIATLLGEPDARLLLDPGRAFGVVRGNRVLTVAALDEDAAGRVLGTALAAVEPGATAEFGWMTGGQQWAVRAAVAAGLEMHGRGAVMVRGWPRPPDCYLPNGVFG